MQRFRDAVEQYRHRVYTFSYYCLGNSEDAEDVTQEVLLRLWRNWRKLDGSDPLGWLMRVTKNACVDVARKRRSYRAVVSEGDCEDVLAGAVDGRPDPNRRWKGRICGVVSNARSAGSMSRTEASSSCARFRV